MYVARVAFGAKDSQTVKAFTEAASYSGTSLIIAYSHCIAHEYNLPNGLEQQKLAVETGCWLIYRYDPRRRTEGNNPLVLDYSQYQKPVSEFMENEMRYKLLGAIDPDRSKQLGALAQRQVEQNIGISQGACSGAHRRDFNAFSKMKPYLSTTYLGLRLTSFFLIGKSPLVNLLDNVLRLEDQGASGIVLHSLFE